MSRFVITKIIPETVYKIVIQGNKEELTGLRAILGTQHKDTAIKAIASYVKSTSDPMELTPSVVIGFSDSLYDVLESEIV